MVRRTDKEASDDATTAYLRFDRGSIGGPLPGLLVGLPERASPDRSRHPARDRGRLLPDAGSREDQERFTDKYGIEVQIDRFDADTVRRRSIGDFQAGAANYDIIMGPFYDVGLFAANHWVTDVGEALEQPGWKLEGLAMDNFPDAILNLCCRYQGHLYALPASAQAMFLWYRKDLFSNTEEQANFQKRYGYPLPQPTPQRSMTWDQYRDVAEFFTRPAGSTAAGETLQQDLYGTALQAKNHVALWFEFLNFLHSFGGRFVSPDGTTVVADSANAVDALEYYVSLKQFSPPGTLNYTWDEALSTFQSGQIAMLIMWSDAIQAVEDPSQSEVAGKVGFSAVPTVKSDDSPVAAFGGWGLFVNAKSQHKREATELIQWANLPEVQLQWAKVGGIPATRSTYHRGLREPARCRGPHCRLGPPGRVVYAPFRARMIETGQNELAQAAAGEVTPAEAMKQIAERLARVIDQQPKPE